MKNKVTSTPVVNEFAPMKLDVNIEGYNQAQRLGDSKIQNFKHALEWCWDNYVKEDDLDIAAFNEDMMLAYESAFMKRNSKIIKMPLSYAKLRDLLDVNIEALKEFHSSHEENHIKLEVIENDIAKVQIDLEDYTIYTKNEKENDMLEAAEDLITAIKNVSKYVKVYSSSIAPATSNFVGFDQRKNIYRINTKLLQQI
jgi:hypothetical protein